VALWVVAQAVVWVEMSEVAREMREVVRVGGGGG
jgi:hypothetical protein